MVIPCISAAVFPSTMEEWSWFALALLWFAGWGVVAHWRFVQWSRRRWKIYRLQQRPKPATLVEAADGRTTK